MFFRGGLGVALDRLGVEGGVSSCGGAHCLTRGTPFERF